MPVTLSDIAEKADVSVSTVSRVLNKKASRYRISSETEELILRTAQNLNYKPNHLARGLRLQRTNRIGLIVPDVSNPFFAAVTKRVQKVAHELGYSLVVCNTDENLDLEVDHVNLLYRERVDGLIAMPVGREYDHFIEWKERDLPLVLLDRVFDEFKTDSVVVDNYQGARTAVEHLIEHGHKHIAIVQGLPGTSTSNARLRGYRDALHSHDLPVRDELIVGGDFRQERGYTETRLLLNLGTPPTAAFLTSDLITLGGLRAIAKEKLSIPDDISIVTFDDFEFAPFLKCPLSAVRQPKEHMGEMAVKLLSEGLTGKRSNPQRIQLQPELVVRESVKMLN